MSNMYDRDGNPIDSRRWGELHADREYTVVGFDVIGEVSVSTVWLGIDHGWGDRLLIFETMVFSDLESASERACERYTTRQEALSGHTAMVEKYKSVQAALESICSCPVVKDDD